MKELNNMEIAQVSGAGLLAMFTGAVVGATSYAFIGGKWGGLSGLTTLGISQLAGTLLGLVIGGVGGALYGVNHTEEEVQEFFEKIVENAG